MQVVKGRLFPGSSRRVSRRGCGQGSLSSPCQSYQAGGSSSPLPSEEPPTPKKCFCQLQVIPPPEYLIWARWVWSHDLGSRPRYTEHSKGYSLTVLVIPQLLACLHSLQLSKKNLQEASKHRSPGPLTMRPLLAPMCQLVPCSCVYVLTHALRCLNISQRYMHSQQSEDGVGTP